LRERSRIVNHGRRQGSFGALVENSTSWQGPSNAYFEGPFAYFGGLALEPVGLMARAARLPTAPSLCGWGSARDAGASPQILCTARWMDAVVSMQNGG